MASSGLYVNTTTAEDIIKSALRKCQAIDVDQPLETVDLNTGKDALNLMVKYLQSKGANLWTQVEGILFLDVDKENYQLGPSGDECCFASDFVSTTTDAAEVTSQTVISVTSTTGFTIADKIGIELDDGTRHWTTIVSFVTNDTVTITTGLASAAASGNTVYTYTTAIPRPMDIAGEMTRHQETLTAEEVPVRRWSREEYMNQTDKGTSGDVVNDYYNPTLTNGTYYVWQPASNVKSVVRFTMHIPLEIFSATSDNPSFPDEWILPVTFKLAETLAPEYKTDQETFVKIKMLAEEYMDDVEGFDEDQAHLQLVPWDENYG